MNDNEARLPREITHGWCINDNTLTKFYPSHINSRVTDFGDIWQGYICAVGEQKPIEEFSIDEDKHSHMYIPVDSVLTEDSDIIKALGYGRTSPKS